MRALASLRRRLSLKTRYATLRARQAIDAQIRARRPTLALEQVQRRLELMLAAVHDRPIAIAPAPGGSSPWIMRAWRLAVTGTRVGETTPEIAGDSIYLPAELSARDGEARTLARYRLFVIEQAERITRGTADHAPFDDPLQRDLYLVREGAAIDAHIATAHPGMRDTLARERASALAARPDLERLNVSERGVELLLREALSSTPEEGGVASDPAESLAWARETAERMRRTDVAYRGVEPAPIWGAVRRSASPSGSSNQWRREESRPIEHIIARKYSLGQTEVDSDAATGRSRGTSEKYTVRGQAPEGSRGASDQKSPRAETGKRAQESRRPETIGTAATNDPLDPSDRPDLVGIPPAVWYDEWDADVGGYVKRAAGVRLAEPIVGDDRWAMETLRGHAAIVRQVRQQFERLRARRTLLPKQRTGDELDLAAYVSAIVDRRAGQAPDDRLYHAARPARRELAITLLVDASGSTKVTVADGRSIIEIEKIALLLAMEALDALGDRFAAYAFAGRSAQNVALTPIRRFGERGLDAAHRAIAALEPGGFTRLGAAVRYATQELAHQSAGHRLLLILSDGRPNDVDRYQGPYGVEDSRQAIMEARASGVFPFCITVDRDASEYLPRIFGRAGHTILQRTEQLPTALLGVVRALIRKP